MPQNRFTKAIRVQLTPADRSTWVTACSSTLCMSDSPESSASFTVSSALTSNIRRLVFGAGSKSLWEPINLIACSAVRTWSSCVSWSTGSACHRWMLSSPQRAGRLPVSNGRTFRPDRPVQTVFAFISQADRIVLPLERSYTAKGFAALFDRRAAIMPRARGIWRCAGVDDRQSRSGALPRQQQIQQGV